jgi:predicted nucleic acid-binding protein
MIALDTNVLLYACDRADSRRQQIATDLVANSKDGLLLWAERLFSKMLRSAPALQTLR